NEIITIILENNLYDEDYLIKNTFAPFLVREDNGKLLRLNNDEDEDVDNNPYLVWDEKSESAKPFNEKGIKPALEGNFTIDNVKTKTVFSILKENQEQYTLEWAAEKTEIKKDMINELTKEYEKRGPNVLFR